MKRDRAPSPVTPSRHASISVALAVLGIMIALSFRTANAASLEEENRANARSLPSTTVGVSATIEQIKLPGSELEAKPIDEESPIVIRIAGSFPHGTDWRYDLVYYGLEPGTYDLTKWLQRKDGSSTDDLPAIEVEVTSVLPPGQIQPNPLESVVSPQVGGYRTLLVVLAVVWVIGLFAILFVRRRSREIVEMRTKPRTLADRLRPLVERAIAGDLPQDRTAELERALIAYWRKRLHIEDVPASEAITKLHAHAEAGALLGALERWLHRPGGDPDVDVAKLLAPYQDIPEDALEAATT